MKATCITCKKLYHLRENDEGECFDCVERFMQRQLSLMKRTDYRNSHKRKVHQKVQQWQRDKIKQLFNDNWQNFRRKFQFADFCIEQGLNLSRPVIMRESQDFWNETLKT